MKLKACVSHIVLIQEIFLILLCIKVDNNHQWNWFLLFTPLWTTDLLLLIPAIYETVMIVRYRRSEDRPRDTPKAKSPVFVTLYLGLVICKVAAELLICLKKENQIPNLKTYYVFIPIWLALLGLFIGTVFITYDTLKTNKTT